MVDCRRAPRHAVSAAEAMDLDLTSIIHYVTIWLLGDICQRKRRRGI